MKVEDVIKYIREEYPKQFAEAWENNKMHEPIVLDMKENNMKKEKQEKALADLMKKMAKEEKKYTVKNGMIVETDNKKEKQEYLKG